VHTVGPQEEALAVGRLRADVRGQREELAERYLTIGEPWVAQ
jgi:hypothetical protein